jgi:hypothetical protein
VLGEREMSEPEGASEGEPPEATSVETVSSTPGVVLMSDEAASRTASEAPRKGRRPS